MKVKCILSHEKPMGRVFRAGEVYDLYEFEERFFVPVEKVEKEPETAAKKKTGKKKKELYN